MGTSRRKQIRNLACKTSLQLMVVAFLLILLSMINQMFYVRGGFAKVKVVLGGKPHQLGTDSSTGSGLHEESCVSRHQSSLYRKNFSQKPSPYLISRLRNYENLHKQCGPYTESYNRTMKRLKAGSSSAATGCKYIVWTAHEGLGNRILTMASAFLYALLTNRVLLVDHEAEMVDLFCEPFPNTSWLLPADFPLKPQFKAFNRQFPYTLGNMLKSNLINSSTRSPLPSFLYLYLVYNGDEYDENFYCDQYQTHLLHRIPWLIVKSDQYFAPYLFLISSFQQELSMMFPDDKESVFHHLGSYLFHPSNRAWGLITRFFQSYLAKADERIGIQVRIFDPNATSFQLVMDQIIACALKEKLLPQVNRTPNNVVPSVSTNQTSKAVVIASLYSEFYEGVRNMYWNFPTVNGEVISVFQPSHEGYQKTDDSMHNMKAWVEVFLLSFCDVLVTSSRSTFGYVAQGLGGLKPWILDRPDQDGIPPDPACFPAMSLEPCFHVPPSYDCGVKGKADIGALVPHVRRCEDEPLGIKLANILYHD